MNIRQLITLLESIDSESRPVRRTTATNQNSVRAYKTRKSNGMMFDGESDPRRRTYGGSSTGSVEGW